MMRRNGRGPVRAAIGVLFCASLVLSSSRQADATQLNLLFLGNSFMSGYGGSPKTIPELVSEIAVAAGHDAPLFIPVMQDGSSLSFHVGLVPTILDATPDIAWDAVIMQDFSTRPTHITPGGVAAHRADILNLYSMVSAHSPNVKPVLFETWARGYGHPYYEPPTPEFPGGPEEMQAEVRAAIELAAGDVDAYAGQQVAQIASVGQAFQFVGFAPILYGDAAYHASTLGTLIAAMITYSTIYDDANLDEIDYTDILAGLELTEGDGEIALDSAVTVVPEPSSIVLCGMALLSVGLFRVKRRSGR